jgi:hypothetical protein
MALSSPVYNTLKPFYRRISFKSVNKLGCGMDFPSRSEVTWIWTLNVSIGWIKHVANAPEIPPIMNGANESRML